MDALDKYRIIFPHLEQNVSLSSIAKQHGVSVRTLRRWINQYEQDNLNGLERKARNDKGQRRNIDSELEEYVKALALSKPKLSITTIYRKLLLFAKKQQSEVPSYSTVYDIVRSLNPSLITLVHEGSVAYRNQYELIYRRESSASNDMWQTDHCQLDILLLNKKGIGQKPWLTIVQDDYSRAIAGYFVSFDHPCAINTALSLRQAIWNKSNAMWQVCGIPEVLYTDNGSDFISHHIEKTAASLKIRIIHSIPGRPQGKGRVERFFLTLLQQFLEQLPGYTPSNKGFLKNKANGAKRTLPKATLTLTDFSNHIESFIVEQYHQAKHSTTGQTPIQRWLGNGFLPQMPSSLESLDILLLTVPTLRKVRRDGIFFNNLRYTNTILAAYIGESVTIRYDPRDMAEIRVYFEGEFLCNAICQNISNQVIGYEEIKSARQKQKRKLRKTINEAKQLLNQLENGKKKTDPPIIKPAKSNAPRIKRYYNE